MIGPRSAPSVRWIGPRSCRSARCLRDRRWTDLLRWETAIGRHRSSTTSRGGAGHRSSCPSRRTSWLRARSFSARCTPATARRWGAANRFPRRNSSWSIGVRSSAGLMRQPVWRSWGSTTRRAPSQGNGATASRVSRPLSSAVASSTGSPTSAALAGAARR